MYISREIENTITKYLDKKEIIAVVGPRQSGKTTMLKQILSKKENVNYITFDDIEMLNLFQNDVKLFVELNVANYDYVFIDEVQYAKESGKLLKYIYDTTKTKLLISGSSTAEISIQSLKYLVGRIFIFELFPFSFSEFLLAKAPALHKIFLKGNLSNNAEDLLKKNIEEYLLFGGYPRVVISENTDEKKLVLRNIYNTLILREVYDLFGLNMRENFTKLLKSFAVQIGNLINYTDLCELTGLKYSALKKSIQILEMLYIVGRCYPYSKNKRIEVVKNPKIYFIDSGLRNIILNNFQIERSDLGAMYENLIFSEFVKKGIQPNYWRTKSGAEIDFVNNNIPVEVKLTPKTSKSLFSYIKKYSPPEAYVVSQKKMENRTIENTIVKFTSFPEFIANLK